MTNKDVEIILRKRELEKYLVMLPGFIHNINTPIMYASGMMEIIQFKHPEIDSTEKIIKQIEKINKMTELLSSIINMEGNTAPQDINLSSFIESFITIMQFNNHFKHKIKITKQIDPDINIHITSKTIANLFYELLSECAEMIERSGDVDIVISTMFNHAIIDLQRDGFLYSEEDCKTVNDAQEIGFNNDKLLGLMVVKHLAESSGGSFFIGQVESKTKFLLKFPLAQE